jgi:(E)-4-hydroxy-3-methylbut-2-enyl-diphosphate synthase
MFIQIRGRQKGDKVCLNETEMSGIEEIQRKETKEVKVGGLRIGGKNPVVIQEMTSTRTSDIDATVSQINRLAKHGCKLVRVSVLDEESARAVKRIKEQVEVPLVADIHFNYKLALLAIESGIDKLRLNPGNIGGAGNVNRVVSAAKERGIPIRVGVNSGSLERSILKKYSGITAEGMVESALNEVALLEKHGFYNTVISLKSSDIGLTIESNKVLSSKVDYPLHIGITESGYGEEGRTRSIVGLGILLLNGIGDTIRVSLTTSDRLENIRLCRDLLEELRVPYV